VPGWQLTNDAALDVGGGIESRPLADDLELVNHVEVAFGEGSRPDVESSL
jgi:hypothetical protein